MPAKVLDANGNGSDEDIARGIRWAVDHGARVVNLSVAAAGNDGSSDRTYPAAEPLAIGVAAPARVRRALVAGAARVAGASFGSIDAARTIGLCRSYASSAG